VSAHMSLWEILLTIAGLGAITLGTRAFFLIPRRAVPMPAWLVKGLRYAPLAALVAVIAPEVVMTDGALISTWRDARLFAVAAASLWYFSRRTILGTIVTGTAVMLALRLGLGW
jgi:branched-subunit amino acid transport protein